MTRRLHVLVVDDTAVNRELFGSIFAGLDLELSEAGSGEEAIDICKQRAPDLIFMDVQMPKMDGIETARRLRGLDGVADTKLLFVTADASPSIIRRCQETGPCRVVEKPINALALRAELDEMIRSEGLIPQPRS